MPVKGVSRRKDNTIRIDWKGLIGLANCNAFPFECLSIYRGLSNNCLIMYGYRSIEGLYLQIIILYTS